VGKPYAIAVGVSTRNDVRLVEQAAADFAGDMGSKTVEVGLESFEMLGVG
jgi:hypothetical protein